MVLKNMRILTTKKVLRTSKEEEGFPMNDAFTSHREPIFILNPPLPSHSVFGSISHSKNHIQLLTLYCSDYFKRTALISIHLLTGFDNYKRTVLITINVRLYSLYGFRPYKYKRTAFFAIRL